MILQISTLVGSIIQSAQSPPRFTLFSTTHPPSSEPNCTRPLLHPLRLPPQDVGPEPPKRRLDALPRRRVTRHRPACRHASEQCAQLAKREDSAGREEEVRCDIAERGRFKHRRDVWDSFCLRATGEGGPLVVSKFVHFTHTHTHKMEPSSPSFLPHPKSTSTFFFLLSSSSSSFFFLVYAPVLPSANLTCVGFSAALNILNMRVRCERIRKASAMPRPRPMALPMPAYMESCLPAFSSV